MSTIACCYLTHNHPDAVREVLDQALRDYAVHGIDIWVYDDSDDERTRDLVETRIRDGAGNLFYVDAHLARNGDDKLLRILMGYGLPDTYDYIWPVKDRICFSDAVLGRICAMLESNPDVIQLADEYERWDVSRPMNRDEYNDPSEFYCDYNAFTINWEGTIRRRESMLDPIDWDRWIRDYQLEEENFVQPITLFARLAEMDRCSIRVCRYDISERFTASVGDSCGWRSDVFGTWIDHWVKANYKLPQYYDPCKIKGIRQQTMSAQLFASVDAMIGFRAEGKFGIEIFQRYQSFWPMVSALPIQWLELIALDRYEELFNLVLNDFEKAIQEQDYLRAHGLFFTNGWMDQIYDPETYQRLRMSFLRYRRDMITQGKSDEVICL